MQPRGTGSGHSDGILPLPAVRLSASRDLPAPATTTMPFPRRSRPSPTHKPLSGLDWLVCLAYLGGLVLVIGLSFYLLPSDSGFGKLLHGG